MKTRIMLAVTAMTCVGLLGHGASSRAALTTAAPAPVCDGAIQHPLTVRVTPTADPVRGSILTASLEVSVDRAFDDVTVRLTDAGGAPLVGPAELNLGALPAGGRGSAAFSVEVPAKGHRFLLQFEVVGEGPAGRMTRGATYNLLPDGPADPGQVTQTDDGRSLRTYAASARRIDR